MRDLRSVQIFREVARVGGFSSAARQLNVTPAAISRTISKLEEQLGVRLFYRTTSQFHLTPEGESLLDAIGSSLDALDGALSDFGQGKDKPSGKLRVSLTNSYGKFYVIPRLPIFFARYPDIKLEIGFDDNRRSLVASGFDVGTSYGPPRGGSYVSRVVCRPRLAVVASPSYLAAHGIPQSPADLAKHHCVGSRLGSDMIAAWRFSSRTASSGAFHVHDPGDRLVLSDQIDGVVQAAAAGLGITVSHIHSLMPYLRSGQLCSLLNDYEVHAEFGGDEVVVFFPHREHLAPRVRAFVDFLTEEDSSDQDVDLNRFASKLYTRGKKG